MKKIYFSIILISFSFISLAQSTLYTENFELPSGADSISSAGNPGWVINSLLAYEGVQSYHAGIVQSDTSHAQTIQFSTTGYSFVMLSFAHIAKISFFDSGILEISYDNINWTKITSSNSIYLGTGNFSAATGDKFTAVAYADWQPANNNAVPTNAWWKEELFNISNLAGNQSQVWLRFKSYDGNNNGSEGNYGWLLDDIIITGYICDPALTPGIASSSHDSVCNLTPVTLSVSGHYGDIQWIYSIDGGANWQNASGTGSNSDEFIVNPLQSIMHAVVTSLGSCTSDTSNIISIYVEQVVAPTTTGASRCGIGSITLTASGNGVLNWYPDTVSTTPLDTGTSFTTYITGTTTFYVSSLVGGSLAPSSVTVGTDNVLNTTTTYPAPYGNWYWGARHQFLILKSELNALGVNGSVDINSLAFDVAQVQGVALQNFEIKIGHTSATDLSSWQTGLSSTYLVSSYTETAGWNIHSFNTPFTWNGSDNIVIETCFNNGSFTNNAIVRQSPTTFISSRWYRADAAGVCANTGQTGTANQRPNIQLEITGGGCESPRTPVTATMNFADAVTINATQVSLCEGESTTLSASSNNIGYNYTWSPSTGLNTTTGSSVIATPLTPTWYYSVGDDGTCANIDSVFIDVGPIAVAGNAVSPADTVCTGNSTTLSLIGSAGNIQWQSSTDGVNWQNETGTGFNTTQYSITPLVNTYYQAVVSSAGCPSDTTNILFVTSLSPSAPTVINDTRCGYGPVNLQASGNGTLYWYSDSLSNSPINTGTTFSPVINTTTTYYVANLVGSAGGGSAILITEADLGNTDGLEIMNVSGGPVDVTGWTVAISDSYTNIDLVNATVKTLNGIMNPGDILYWTDGTVNPWGTNMFWNPGAFPTFTGWAIILDNFGNIVDYVVWAWPDANIQAMNTTIAGFPVTIGPEWSGDGVNSAPATAGLSLSRQGNIDNDDATDFNIQASSLGVANPGLTPPFAGGGCSSPKVAITATVTPPPPITVTASLTSICLGDTSELIASSPNTAYNYTWSPAAGLNTTIGDTVYASPTVPTTYTVIADDGNCGNIDSIFINYGVSSAANPITTGDTICGPGVVNLSGQGSGNLYWFEVPAGGIPVGTGTTYSPSITQTDTFYVQALVGGDYFNIGPVNNGFGNQSSINTSGWGMTFDVSTTSTLDRVYIYPWATGSVTINLKQGTGPILQTITVLVTAFTGKTPVDLGWQLVPGTGYRLELGSGSVAIGRNTTGASYPYTVANGPVTITGYFNPNPGSGANVYLYFYDWLVSTGCKSNRVPVTGVVMPVPAVPTISQVGNMLVSSSPANNQWYFQGNPIPGATGQTYQPTQQGQYYVVVGGANCFQISNSLFFIPIGINEIEYINLNVYPNPGNGIFNIEFASLEGKDALIEIYNVLGEIIYKEEINKLSGFYKSSVNIAEHSNGLYFLMIKCAENKYFEKLILSK